MQKAVFEYIVEHPTESAGIAFLQLITLMSARTTILADRLEPDHEVLTLYRPIVWICGFFLLLRIFLYAKALFLWRKHREEQRHEALADPTHMITLILVGFLMIVSVGDKGEEARFLIAALPFLATMPILKLLREKILFFRGRIDS